MALFDSSVKSNSTSIGGSTQTINFNPVLNARGASSGNSSSGGVTQAARNTLTDVQGGSAPAGTSPDTGSGAEGFQPGLGLASEARAPIQPSALSYEPPSKSGLSPALLAGLAVVAVVGLLWMVRS
jgi:cobalamin biosynthesis Mg chelatase CobN